MGMMQEPKRSNKQNSKMWAMLTDLEKQLVWYGRRMTKEEWKDLICHEWKPQQLVPAISSGFCVLTASTSTVAPREFADIVEIIYAFGTEQGVNWSEPALAAYEEYSQLQREQNQ
ncbi:recombination protein NinB [Gilvimarinus chinensis]|uniref:recombination protein NinB n=1 Tax=Gilvimarinus chinensis TaxID=396005 RepID=UPI00068482AA|nr:recombination protein NinB [Gilvimarinus chinensis]